MKSAILAAAMSAFGAIASVAEQRSLEPPTFELAVPPPFSMSSTIERHRAGEDTGKSPPFRFITTAPVTTRYGSFVPSAEKKSDVLGWSVKVYATFSEKVAAACASKKDGYQLGLENGPGLEIPEWGSYMVARLRRKQFSWGKAVSFLSQFTQDTALYAPHNGRLTYEVCGVTTDRKYTVVAHVSVSHPKLPDWEDDAERFGLRAHRSLKALKRDPDYKLIERCKPEEFTPSLTAFDQMLDSLTIR